MNPLASHYSRFRVDERLLLTGHSHQAWPDVAYEAQKRAWLDAAELVDGKWVRVAEMDGRVVDGFRRLMGECDGDFALDTNTHALVTRFLSALPLLERPRLVTTDGEFHTIRRQLDRLAEEGLEVVKVSADPVDTLCERMALAVDARTSAVLVSSVLFGTGLIVPHLEAIGEACERNGAELLVDAYHSLGVVPFSLAGIGGAFVVGGGYKYCQLGEGNCVLRIPPGCTLRPVLTGWFSEFGELSDEPTPGRVRYGEGALRFAGSTYDPTSRYRAAAVFDFFVEQGLDIGTLREVSQAQVGLLEERFRGLNVDPAQASVEGAPLPGRGGFLAIRMADAGGVQRALLERGVLTDCRGSTLRLGPAPYLSDAQLVASIEALGEVLR